MATDRIALEFGSPVDGVKYHLRAEIFSDSDGRWIRLVVTRVEERVALLSDPDDALASAMAAMRSMGDSDSPSRAVEVCRTLDPEIQRMLAANPEWRAMCKRLAG